MGQKRLGISQRHIKMATNSSDTVSFKVFLKSLDGEVQARRFVVDRDVATSFTYLQEKLVSLFPGPLRRSNFVLSWVDEDGDNVTVGTDEELVLALTEMAGPTYKITCTIKDIPDDICQVGGFIEELEIYDQQLVPMETMELDKLLKKRGVSNRKQKAIKQRRRSLKNRVYAANFRRKRLEEEELRRRG